MRRKPFRVIYTIAGNLIAVYLNQKRNKINQEELEFKADFNYCLTHVRNHAESIAFFQGDSLTPSEVRQV